MNDLTNDDLKAFLAATERETVPLSPQLRDYIVKLNAELARLRAQLAAAESIVARGVELMPLEQLSQWEGVRAWQEMK